MLTWTDKASQRARLSRWDRAAEWLAKNFGLYCLALVLMLAAGCVAVWRIG